MELTGKVDIKLGFESGAGIEPGTIPDAAARRSIQEEPDATPVIFQTWEDLLFLHWEWDPFEIQASLPPGLFVDTHGAKAYVGLIPFRMSDVRASFLPHIPGAANFLELNVRTYVYDQNGRPGVWFYSLDLNHGLGVLLAKTFYSLPYHSATMEAQNKAGLVEFKCQRQTAPDPSQIYYRREAKTVASPPGSLPSFLTDRYLLYSFSPRTQKLYSARVFHAPWQLFQAHLGRYDETMLRLNKLNPHLRPPDHRWMGSPVRVKIYPLQDA